MDRRRPTVFSAIVIAAMAVVSAWAWLALPADAQVPIHWGPSGAPDGWAGKTIGLFLLPLVTIGIAALLWVIPVVEPRRANFEKSGKAYGAIWVAIIGLMAAIQLVAVAAALGWDIDMTLVALVGTGVVFVVIGNYLPKVRPNYMMGIRTPWTLTSDLAWDRTHRLGGRLFVVEGIVFILLGLVRPPAESFVVVLIGGIVLMLVFCFAYSYRVWKTDPQRRAT
jgi:uncharacterized membrane protein